MFLGTPQNIDPAALPLPQPAQSWAWLVDLQRTCALFVGRVLGSMLIGPLLSKSESDCEKWLNSPLLNYGLENRDPPLGRVLFFTALLQSTYALLINLIVIFPMHFLFCFLFLNIHSCFLFVLYSLPPTFSLLLFFFEDANKTFFALQKN